MTRVPMITKALFLSEKEIIFPINLFMQVNDKSECKQGKA
jgi:hypothetical protein